MEIENDISTSTTKGTLCGILMDYTSTNDTVIENDECDDSISTKTYIDGFVLGSFYTVTYILIACFMQFIRRGWITCEFFFFEYS